MDDCICGDGTTVTSDKRVTIYEPNAVVRNGAVTMQDNSKIHVFHADCPKHGYHVLTEEEPVSE